MFIFVYHVGMTDLFLEYAQQSGKAGCGPSHVSSAERTVGLIYEQQLICGLTLMPNLLHLFLKDMHISPSDLEALHANAAQLTSLSLLNTTAQAGYNLPPTVVIVDIPHLHVELSEPTIEIIPVLTNFATYISSKSGVRSTKWQSW